MSQLVRTYRRQRGVTVLEIGIAVTILLVVAVGIFLVVRPSVSADRAHAAVRNAERIREAVANWRTENSRGCPTISQLQQERHLSSDIESADPWGERFRLICDGETVNITSAGSDGKLNTEDDIIVPYSQS